MTTIRAEGIDSTAADLARIEKGIEKGMPEWMKKGVLHIQSKIPGYPAPPAGSTYERTGTLGRVLTAFGGGSFANGAQPLSRVETFNNRTVGYIGGRLSYITHVVGDEDGKQAWMHQGRWYRLIDIVRQNIDGVVRIFEDGIQGLIK